MKITLREAQAAHRAVAQAIADGELLRDWCEVCGEEAQAHHDDYRRPLDVRWLCRSHHRLWHNQHPSGVDWNSDGKQIVTFRIPRALLEQVEALAADNHRTLSQEIRLAMVKHLAAAARA